MNKWFTYTFMCVHIYAHLRNRCSVAPGLGSEEQDLIEEVQALSFRFPQLGCDVQDMMEAPASGFRFSWNLPPFQVLWEQAEGLRSEALARNGCEWSDRVLRAGLLLTDRIPPSRPVCQISYDVPKQSGDDPTKTQSTFWTAATL